MRLAPTTFGLAIADSEDTALAGGLVSGAGKHASSARTDAGMQSRPDIGGCSLRRKLKVLR